MNTTVTPLVIEKVLNAPVSMVWKAISDRDEMSKWYFNLKEFKPVLGFQFDFTAGPDSGKKYLHVCEITRVEPEKVLAYSWRYDGYEGISEVTFELFPEGNNTRLKLTHEGLENFPASNPDFVASNFVAGWTAFITDRLPAYLEKLSA